MKLIIVFLMLQVLSLSRANQNEDDFARATRLFSATFYTQLTEANMDKPENIIFSPLSIYETLGMILAGADANTKIELKQTMELNQTYTDRQIHSHMTKLYKRTVTHQKGQEFIMGNAMFSNINFHILNTYLSTLKYKYKAYHRNINMTNQQMTQKSINDWVEQTTRGKIKNIIQSIPKSAKIILINAIYFNGTWKHSFKEATNSMPFTLASGQIENKTYMTLEENFPFHVDINAHIQFLAIPYSSPTTSYFVIGLPFANANLSSFNEGAGEILPSLPPVEQWQKLKLLVKMPKFNIETNINVKQVLQQMGVQDLFNSNSHLNGVSPMPLSVSQFVHKAYIKVNEKGTEAAAASAAILSARSLAKTIEFIVNKPFFFAIYNKQAKVHTFMGKIDNPQP